MNAKIYCNDIIHGFVHPEMKHTAPVEEKSAWNRYVCPECGNAVLVLLS